MNTKKIRIGNDIRLAVDLRQYLNPGRYLKEREVYNPGDEDYENIDSNPFVNKKYEVYYPEQYHNIREDSVDFKSDGTPISIRSVKAVLINTTLRDYYTDKIRRKSRFITRFPIEPCLEAFHATPYDICNSGYPTWRAYPRRHIAFPYHGFGVNPHWDGIYKPLPMIKHFEYRAGTAATKYQNVVEVSFPARHQLHTGLYTLILVVKVYAPGFNHQNLKTITIDIPHVFELVKTSAEGVDGDVIGKAQQIIDKLPYDLYVDDDTDDGDCECNCGWEDPDQTSNPDYLLEREVYSPTDTEFNDMDDNETVEWSEMYGNSSNTDSIFRNEVGGRY